MKRASQYRVAMALQESERVWTVDDIVHELHVDERTAQDIHRVAYEDTYGWFSELYRDGERAKELCSWILEGLHQGMDGWSIADRMVIELFLADLKACEQLTRR